MRARRVNAAEAAVKSAKTNLDNAEIAAQSL